MEQSRGVYANPLRRRRQDQITVGHIQFWQKIFCLYLHFLPTLKPNEDQTADNAVSRRPHFVKKSKNHCTAHTRPTVPAPFRFSKLIQKHDQTLISG
jgi:hypothetical protein